MKTKIEKVMELTPITMGINYERDSKIAKRWSHKGLDLLIKMWHTYYNTTSHLALNSLMTRFSERQLNLEKLEECMKGIQAYAVD